MEPDVSQDGYAVAGDYTLKCKNLTVDTGKIGDGQSAATLAKQELAGTEDVWENYVEFSAATKAECEFTVPKSLALSTLKKVTLHVNYRGPDKATMPWVFELYDVKSQKWTKVADNQFAKPWTWTAADIEMPLPFDGFVASSSIRMRYRTSSSADSSQLDAWVIKAQTGATCTPVCEGKTCGSDDGCNGTCQSGSGCQESTTSFSFISWSDSQDYVANTPDYSNQAAKLNPNFTIYPGDLVEEWSNSKMDTWVSAINGGQAPPNGNGLYEKTFMVRGNHDDDGDAAGYANYLASHQTMKAVAEKVGATNFSSHLLPDGKNNDYSFDFGNSHFAGLEGGAEDQEKDALTKDQLAWLDKDLTSAEERGLTHAFIFFHRPVFTVGNHYGAQAREIIPVLNAHPIVTATFHGHEHVYAHVLLNDQFSDLTNPVHEFIDGSVGVPYDPCKEGTGDHCFVEGGFVEVTVSDRKVTVRYHTSNGPVSESEVTITKEGGTTCTPICSGKVCGESDGCDGTCKPGSGCDESTSAAGTIVPLYSDPSERTWTQLLDAKKKHPSVPVVAIINPSDGPGSSADAAYRSGITRLKDGGCKVLGYVATKYGDNSADSIKDQIAKYHSWYPDLDGIMFDEMSEKTELKGHYSDLNKYTKSLGFTMTVGNPGMPVDASLIGTFDVLFMYESNGLPTLSSLAKWKPYINQVGIIPLAVPSLDANFVKGAKDDVGYIYVTDDVLDNPWDTLSSYFEPLLAALE